MLKRKGLRGLKISLPDENDELTFQEKQKETQKTDKFFFLETKKKILDKLATMKKDAQDANEFAKTADIESITEQIMNVSNLLNKKFDVNMDNMKQVNADVQRDRGRQLSYSCVHSVMQFYKYKEKNVGIKTYRFDEERAYPLDNQALDYAPLKEGDPEYIKRKRSDMITAHMENCKCKMMTEIIIQMFVSLFQTKCNIIVPQIHRLGKHINGTQVTYYIEMDDIKNTNVWEYDVMNETHSDKVRTAMRCLWENSGIRHGDAKPDNIFLSDNDTKVRVIDFGESKFTDEWNPMLFDNNTGFGGKKYTRKGTVKQKKRVKQTISKKNNKQKRSRRRRKGQ